MRRGAWLAVLALAMGCSGSSDGDSPSNDTGDTETPEDTADTGEVDRPKTDVAGVITDSSGAALVGAQIRMCLGELCRNGETGADGSWSMNGVIADWNSYEVVPADDGIATAFAAIELKEGEPRQLDLVIPALGAPVALGASDAPLEVAPGLTLTLSTGTLETPAFAEDATAVRGVKLEPSQYPPVDGAASVAAVYYLAPFDYHAPSGIPAAFDAAAAGLADGSYQVWVGSYEESAWLNAGDLTVAGGQASGSISIPLLSTVAVVTAP